MTTMASDTPLPDQADRNLISGAAGDFDVTVFADAGAGTGKTTALVDRVANLVVSGIPVTEIAAITFTEAAAGELRHRVRTTLEKRRATALDTEDEAAAGLLRDALAELDDATFTTLHGFAHRILAEHPLQAGLPPRFDVFDGLEQDAAFERQWDTWLVELATNPDTEAALERMHLLGVDTWRLRRLVRALVDDQERIPDGLAVAPGPWTPDDPELDEILDHLDRVDEIIASCTDPSDKLLPKLEAIALTGIRVRAWADAGDAAPAELFDLLRQLVDQMKLRSFGSKGSWPHHDSGKAVRDEVKQVGAAAKAVISTQTHDLLRILTCWSAWFVRQWRDQRWRDATLVFADLLIGARDLLRRDPRVRRRLADRWRHLLVDEFQDTDPVQVELAMLLAATNADEVATVGGPSGRVAWNVAVPEPGKLFFVGDPKQSIYGFRGADIAVYEGVKQLVADSAGQVRHLTHNFRSVPGVLDWVNAVFEQVMQPEPLAQPDYLHLSPARPGNPVHPRPVRWFGGNDDDLRAQEKRMLQAEQIATAVSTIVGSEQVVDDDGTSRPARHDDVAVLVRRHATARQLEQAFRDADVPYVVQARSLVFGTDEVRDLRTILTAIDDPNDHVAVVGALRHPALGCSDADLVTWRDAGGRWTPPGHPDDLSVPEDAAGDHPVARGLRRLAELASDREDATVGGFVEHVIERLGLLEIALADGRARDRWRRLRIAADHAHAWHEAGGHLRGFVRWLREQDEQGVRSREHVVVDDDDEAVRITTVHAAKGLEYPVVILAGLDMDLSRPLHDAALLWRPDGTPEVNIGKDLKTCGYEWLRDGDDVIVGARDHHHHEEIRLAYVATTRARDLLVVSLHHTSGKSLAALLTQDFLDREDLWSRLALAPEGDKASETWQPWSGNGDPVADLQAWATHHRRAAAHARRPRTLAATTVADIVAGDGATGPDGVGDEASSPSFPPASERRTTPEEDAADDEPTWRRSRGGSATGRAVHAVLERVDLDQPDSLDAMASTQAAAEGLPAEDAPRIARRVQRALATPIVGQALEAARNGHPLRREVHVGAPVAVDPDRPDGPTVTLEGFIDLLVDIDGELVVVDWKTDTVGERTPEEVAARYHAQAATYAVALETALGRPVERCVFVLTGTGDEEAAQVEVSGAALTSAKNRLHQALQKVAAAPA